MTQREVTLTTIVEDDDLIIRRGSVDGETDAPVIVFSSAGLDARQGKRLEFIGQLGKLGRPSLFVVDKTRTWYAHGDMASRIQNAILDQLETLGADKVDTIGNSMGGFGCLAFGEVLPVRRAIAFSPRFSPDSSIIPDRRLPRLLAEYRGRFPFPTAEKGLRAAESAVVLHGLHEPDLPHARAYSKAIKTGHWVLPVPRHEVAMCLRETNDLFPFVRSFLNGRPERAAEILQRAGAFRSIDDPERLETPYDLSARQTADRDYVQDDAG